MIYVVLVEKALLMLRSDKSTSCSNTKAVYQKNVRHLGEEKSWFYRVVTINVLNQ